MISSFLKNMKANSFLGKQISIRFQRNIRYKHNINKIIPSSLKKRLAISNGIGKEINSILNKNIDGKNLTKCRLEVKGPYNRQIACSSTSNIVSIVEQMNHGHVSLRDGLPKQGFNLTTTASGTLFKTDEWKIQLRFRSYSEIVEIYDDHGIKNTIFKNQSGTNHKSWIEIKATKINIPHHLKSSIPGKLSIKRRMLVDNQLILKMLQSWESRFYMDWIKDQTSSIYNGFCDFSNILLEIKEKSADNPENSIDNCEDVIRIINLLYNDNQHYIMDRLSTYTRRALKLSVSDIGCKDIDRNIRCNTFGLTLNPSPIINDFTFEMTEDRNIQYHYSNKSMDFFSSGSLNPAQYILYGSKVTIPHHFIEFKIPIIQKKDLSNNGKKVYNMIEDISNERLIKNNTGKIGFARKYVFPNVKLPM